MLAREVVHSCDYKVMGSSHLRQVLHHTSLCFSYLVPHRKPLLVQASRKQLWQGRKYAVLAPQLQVDVSSKFPPGLLPIQSMGYEHVWLFHLAVSLEMVPRLCQIWEQWKQMERLIYTRASC